MHVPSCPTDQLELEEFDRALDLANRPAEGYDSAKWLYVPNYYSEYRYILGTRGERPLICVGINPSTAAPDQLDNTLKSVERVALHNGYDSFLMFNVYAQRATDPDDMEFRCNQALHAQNMPLIMSSLWTGREPRRCGPPGGPSLRSGITCLPVSGI